MAATAETSHIELSGVGVEVTERGKGRPLLLLHPGHPAGRIDPAARIMELLAETMRRDRADPPRLRDDARTGQAHHHR